MYVCWSLHNLSVSPCPSMSACAFRYRLLRRCLSVSLYLCNLCVAMIKCFCPSDFIRLSNSTRVCVSLCVYLSVSLLVSLCLISMLLNPTSDQIGSHKIRSSNADLH